MSDVVIIVFISRPVLLLDFLQIPVDDAGLMQLGSHQLYQISHLVDLCPEQEVTFRLGFLEFLQLIQLAVHCPRHDQRDHSSDQTRCTNHL